MRRLLYRALWWVAEQLDRLAVLRNAPTPAASGWYHGLSDEPWDRPVLSMVHVAGRDDAEIVENLLRDRIAA